MRAFMHPRAWPVDLISGRFRRPMTRLVLLSMLLAGCSVVKSAKVSDDWAARRAQHLKRLEVVVAPLPAGNQRAGEAMARIARRYVNQKREFLVKAELATAHLDAPRALCGGDEHIEGLLILEPDFQPKGEGFEATMRAKLLACDDFTTGWNASAAGSFPSKDERLVEVTQVYEQEFGPEVQPFIPPFFNLLRPVLDTLPQPTLDEQDIEEKLTLD